MTETFDVAAPLECSLHLPAGEIRVRAEETAQAVVELVPLNAADEAARKLVERSTITLQGDRLLVDVPRRRLPGFEPELLLTVRVPVDSTLHVRAASAATFAEGRLAAAQAHVASGDVRLDEVSGEIEVRSASADLELRRLGGTGRVKTASGSVRIEQAGGDLDLATASGDVEIGRADGSVRARTASGSVRLTRVSRGSLHLEAASGDLSVGVEPGVALRYDLASVTGGTRCDLDEDDGADGRCDLDVRLRTVSGNVVLTRAAVPAG